MAGLFYDDSFFREFPHRPLRVDLLFQLRKEWLQLLKFPEYSRELRRVFSLFHPPEYAEKHFQAWLHALETVCLDPDSLEKDFQENEDKGDMAKRWSVVHGPAKGIQADKAFEKWSRTLVSILRDQDTLCLAGTFKDESSDGPRLLMVEIIEPTEEDLAEDIEVKDEEASEYHGRAVSRAPFGSIEARLKIVDVSAWEKPFEDDQQLETLLPAESPFRLSSPSLQPYRLLPAIESSSRPHLRSSYFRFGLWYYSAFFRDFPSRPIMANTRAELEEECSKVQDPNYRSELRRIFNAFHVEWSVDYGKTLMADKHLATWLKALDYARSHAEQLGGLNDHNVRYVSSMFVPTLFLSYEQCKVIPLKT